MIEAKELNATLNIDKSKYKKFRFDQIARSISERVEPQQTNLEVYYGLEHLDSNSLHLSRSGVPSDVEGTKLRVYPGDVIFGKRRAYQRKAAICEVDAICSAHAMVLRANPEVIHPKLFPFFLHSDLFMHRAIDISVGSLSPTINWGTLKTQEFLLPPKDQQEKLAELLWAGDSLIQHKQSIWNLLSELRIRNRSSILQSYKKTTHIRNLFEQIKEVQKPPFGNLSYIALEHIISSENKLIEIGNSERVQANCFKFEKGDILYSKLRPYLDKCVIANFDGICSTELLVLRPKEDSTSYLFECLHSQEFIDYVVNSSFGTKMPRTSSSIIGDFVVPKIEEIRNSNFFEKQMGINKSIQLLVDDIINLKMILKQIVNTIFTS